MYNPFKKFATTHLRLISILEKISKTSVVIIGALWTLNLVFIAIFGYEYIAKLWAGVLHLPDTQFITPAAPWSNPYLNEIFLSLYTPFLVISGFATIIGTLVLSPSRNVGEIIALLVGGAIPQQRKYWGLVFDQRTGRPIPFAVIHIRKKGTNEELTKAGKTVTDLDGRYRIYLPIKNSNYQLDVQAEGYAALSKEVDYRHQRLIEDELIEDIPLVKTATTQNSLKSFFYSVRPRLYTPMIYLLFLFTAIAFAWAVYGFVVYFYLDTAAFLCIYATTFFWNCITIYDRLSSKTGKVVDGKNQKPIPGALIQVFNDTRQILSIISNHDGTVKFDLKPGDYTIKVYKENYTVNNNPADDTLTVRITAQGFLSRDIHLYPIADRPIVATNGDMLANPFLDKN